MKLTDKRFWIPWAALLLLLTGSCLYQGCSEDTLLLGIAYALSLILVCLCHKAGLKAAFKNLILMIAYNAILSYNLAFNSQYGAGLTWLVLALLFNTTQSTALLIYYILARYKASR